MSRDIVKAEEQASVASLDWSAEQVETIKRTVAKDATGPELDMFLHLSRTYGLDPFAKEIWFIKMDRGAPTIFTSRDGYLKIANRDPRFEGMEADVVYGGDMFRKTKDGIEHVYGSKDRGTPIGAYCIVHRSDRRIPIYVYAPFKDYARGGNWGRYPHAMILKVAEAQALKRAFSISGLVTQEELDIEPEPQRAASAPNMPAPQVKSDTWHRLLDAFDGNQEAAKAAALAATGGRSSKDWTWADMKSLEDIIRERPTGGEIIDEMMTFDAEVVDPMEAMRERALELMGGAGLDLTEKERGEMASKIAGREIDADLGNAGEDELAKIVAEAEAKLAKLAGTQEP